jgi:TetR/AcrR family transcriptional repressor of nem operon
MPVAPYRSDEKRESLLRAATDLLHEQGFATTTLADVAGRANVPLGNVYYYYKTKDALAHAVIDAHLSALKERFTSWNDGIAEPHERLRRYIVAPLDTSDRIAQFGCPHGSLCQELEKLGRRAPLARAAARLLTAYIEWVSQQFLAMGESPAEARARASDLVAAVQGTMLVAHTLRSRDVLSAQLKRLANTLPRSARSASVHQVRSRA